MVSLWNRADHYIFMLSFVLSFFLSFFSLPNLSRCWLDVCHTSTYGVALVRKILRCRSETCCTRLAEKTGRKKSCQKSPSGQHRTTLPGYIFATKARVDSRKKNLLSSNMSSTCPHNTVNFDPLAAEIGLPVWGTPANFNGFRVLKALLRYCTTVK